MSEDKENINLPSGLKKGFQRDDLQEQTSFFAQKEQNEDNTVVDDPKVVPQGTTYDDAHVPNTVGAILRHAREMLNLSQQDIANKLKLRVSVISDIENDRLNQSTAASFARGYITLYSSLVNIDPEQMLKLYNENIKVIDKKNVNTIQLNTIDKKSNKAKYVIIIVVVLIIVFGIISFLSSQKSTDNNQPGSTQTLIDNSSSNANNSNVEQLEIKESPALNTDANANVKDNANNTNQKDQQLDINNQQAYQQAQNLDANALINDNIKSHENTAPKSNVLSLTTTKEAFDNNIKDKNNLVNSNNDTANIEPSLKDNEQKLSANTNIDNNKPKPDDNKQAVDNTDQDTQTQAQATAREPMVSIDKNKLVDISSQVKIVNKQGLGSMNSVGIKANNTLAYEVYDFKGRLLKQGVLEKNQSVQVTGIPPLKIALSNSADAKVQYLGGYIQMPRAKNVSFILPQR